MEKIFKNKNTSALMALFAMFLWGSAIPMIKTTYKVLGITSKDPGSMILVAGYRFFLAGFFVIFYKFLFEEKSDRKKGFSLMFYIISTVVQITVAYIFYYNGLALISGVHSSIIQSTNFLMVLIFAHILIRDDKFNSKKIICVILGIIATLLSNVGGKVDGVVSLRGEVFIIMSTALNALGTVIMKKWGSKENTYNISIFQFIFGGFLLIIMGLFTHQHPLIFNFKAIILLIYGSFISSTAFVIWYMLLRYQKVSNVGAYKMFIPIFGAFLSVIILKDKFNIYLFVALFLTSFATTFLHSDLMEGKN